MDTARIQEVLAPLAGSVQLRVLEHATAADAAPVVSGAQVIVTAQNEVVVRVESDERGAFEITGLAARAYELHVVREGFRAVPVHIDLTRDAAADVNLRLQVSALSEAVVVSAAQVDLPLSRTPATTTVITRGDLEAYQQTTVAQLEFSLNDALGQNTELFFQLGIRAP